MRISHLDHFVLTVADIDATVAFYTRVLGMQKVVFGEGRVALRFGDGGDGDGGGGGGAQKINLHLKGNEFVPHAHAPVAGGGDFCLIAEGGIDTVIADLDAAGVAIELGPVARTGAAGPMESVYIRDPDRNLVEIAVYPPGRGPRIITGAAP